MSIGKREHIVIVTSLYSSSASKHIHMEDKEIKSLVCASKLFRSLINARLVLNRLPGI